MYDNDRKQNIVTKFDDMLSELIILEESDSTQKKSYNYSLNNQLILQSNEGIREEIMLE